MASASITIGDRPYKDGTTGIYMRIIHDRKIYKKQICKVPVYLIDEGRLEIKHGHPDSTRLNMIINRELSEAKQYLLECTLKKIEPDPDRYLNSQRRGESLVDHITARAEDLKRAGKYRTAAKHTSTANKLVCLRMDVSITAVTVSWVKKLDKALAATGNIPNTRAKHMAVISAVLNEAEGATNPFSTYRKPSNKTSKAKLTRAEFEAVVAADLSGKEDIARWIFVFAVLARGMRAFDVLTLRWENIIGSRLIYTPQKTKEGGKVVDMLITDRMRVILAKFDKSKPDGYIFPIVLVDYSMYTKDRGRYLDNVNRRSWHVNNALKPVAEKAKVNKHITIHVARHTFAYMADQSGVPLGTIQQLLDHGKIGTTQGYVESLRRSDELDKAVEGLF